jgi:hypothetical protein
MRGIRQRFQNRIGVRSIFCGAIVLAGAWAAPVYAHSEAQKSGDEDAPVYTAYRGVHIGSTISETRKALGDPSDKSDVQDVFLVNDSEIATIYYDKDKKVSAISVDFMNGSANPPTPIQVVGAAVEPKPDGSTYKLVRYPKAGCIVMYNRTAGQKPMITVTIQKMQ